MSYMGNGYNMEGKKANSIINEILNAKLKRIVARTIKSGEEAMEQLRTIGYVDTPTVKYGCIGAFKKGVYPHYLSTYKKHSNIDLKGTKEYFDFSISL